MNKVCFKCSTLKDLSEYYKHPQTKDGYLNKCKSCTKIDTKKQTEINVSTQEGLEKERKRHRDKYHKLGYKDSQKEWDKEKPWKNTSAYKNLRRKYKNLDNSFELHHWNYNDDFLEDVFILNINEHKQLHNFISLDLEKRVFTLANGDILNSRDKHRIFIESKGYKIYK